MQGRCTVISFDDYGTQMWEIGRGMDQGCPLSAIAYQYYNPDLVEVVKHRNGKGCMGFINDTMLMAEGADFQEAFNKLADMMIRRGGTLSWAKTHECHFAVEKFGLIGFTRRREKDPMYPKKLDWQHNP